MPHTSSIYLETHTPSSTPTGIVVPLAFFATIGLCCILIFSCVRTVFKDIYLPRLYISSHQQPHLSKGFVSWIPSLFWIKDADMIHSLGLDSVIVIYASANHQFLKFLWMSVRLFALLSFLGLFFLAPVNYYSQVPSFQNSTGFLYEDILLPSLSVNNVPNRSPFLWVHLLFTWIFSLAAIGFLIVFYRETVSSKLKYESHILKDSNLSRVDSRTIMVFGIPRELRIEIELAAYFDSLGIGKVQNVVICRKWTRLKQAVQMRARFLLKLEQAYAKSARKLKRYGGATNSPLPESSFSQEYAVNMDTQDGDFEGFYRPLLTDDQLGYSDESEKVLSELISRIAPSSRTYHKKGFLGCFGQRVDSLNQYLEEFKFWNREVDRLRRSTESSPPTSVGFVTFDSPLTAAIASQTIIHRRPFACMSRMAPEPRDIYWPNLSSEAADSSIKLFRTIIVFGSLLFLVFSSTAVVSTFAGLIDLRQLALYIPGLKDLLAELPEAWIQLIQGVIPTILVAGWTSSLPAVLLLLSKMQGLETESWIEMSVLSKYFFYQLWNILFVQVLVRAVLYELILNPRQFIEVLGQMVPKASPTLINYVMLQATAVYPAQLLLVGPLVLTWLTRLAPWSDASPRQKSDAYYPSILTCINFGIAYPIPMLMFVVGITYAPIAPLILPFCTLFFAIAYFVHKYLFLYVHLPRYENKARVVPMVVNRCLAGLLIMQLTMMGVLALKAIGLDDNHSRLVSLAKPPAWSGYAQMVFGVGPLLFITFTVYWWLKQGYEKEINQVPLEIISRVIRELTRAEGYQGSPSAQNHDSLAFDGQELEAVESQTDKSSSLKISLEQRKESPSVFSPDSRPGSSLFRPDYEASPESEKSPLLPLAPGPPEENVMEYHREPPMTRVPGVLDAPISLDPLGNEENDLQNSTYLHPALIGRLPIPWLSGTPQPPVLERLRAEQARRQSLALKRFLGLQRLGVHAMEEQLDSARTPEARHGLTGGLRNFIDGLTSWAHLSLS